MNEAERATTRSDAAPEPAPGDEDLDPGPGTLDALEAGVGPDAEADADAPIGAEAESEPGRPAGAPGRRRRGLKPKRVLAHVEPAERHPAGPAEDEVIWMRGLTKRYGARTAVDALDLEVRRGEIFGLLGPNGAGKTTTVLMLLGLTEPTAGQVRVAGFDPRHESLQVKRRVGYLPDSVGFYGSLSGRENLRYTARLNGIPGRLADRRIDEVLQQVGLADRADDRADTYSRGMRQRLGIADALVKDPEVLILDEPTTAIDPLGVVEMLDLIRGLASDRGIAILLASHLLDQVQSVCHRVGIFDRGRLIGLGTVADLAVEFGEPIDRLEVALEPGGPAPASALGERITAALGEVSGVTAAEPVEDDWGRGAWRLTLDRSRSEPDVIRGVLDTLASSGARIERLGRSRPSLEQIYRLAVERVAGSSEGAVA